MASFQPLSAAARSNLECPGARRLRCHVLIGARVAAARSAAGMSLAAFSDKLGMDQIRIVEIESGLLGPEASELYDIACALGLSFRSLFSGL